MSEQELIKQLNNLKSIKPDSQWQDCNREVLLNQISRGEEAVKVGWFRMLENMLPHQLTKQLSQPIAVVFLIIAFVVSSGAVSLNASHNTKPGDSLYIAKIISEKAQSAITFDDKEKAKLGMEFAGNRTKEITQILAESDDIEKNQAKVEKLTENFKKEIKTVKSRLVKINIIKDDNSKKEDESSFAQPLARSGATEDKEDEDKAINVFSANSGKSDQGMEVSGPESGAESIVADEQQLDSGAQDQAEPVAGSIVSEDSATGEVEQTDDLEQILIEAEKLFDEQNYDGTLNKLGEASSIIDQIEVSDQGQVKGESIASTTDNNLDDGKVLGVSEEVKENADAGTASSTEE